LAALLGGDGGGDLGRARRVLPAPAVVEPEVAARDVHRVVGQPVHIVHRQRHQQRADDVADGDGDDGAAQHLADADVRTEHHGGGDEGHLRYAVLEADGHEGRDGEPDGQDLARDVLRRLRGPHGQAHQPVAADAAQHGLRPRQVHLLERAVDQEAVPRRRLRQVRTLDEHRRHEQRAREVAEVDDQPVARQAPQADALRNHAQRHDGHVGRDQLAAHDDDEDEAEGEHEGVQPLLQAGVRQRHARRAAAHHDGHQRAQRDVRARHERQDQRLVGAQRRLVSAGSVGAWHGGV